VVRKQLNQAYSVLKCRRKQAAVPGDTSSGCTVEEGDWEWPWD